MLQFHDFRDIYWSGSVDEYGHFFKVQYNQTLYFILDIISWVKSYDNHVFFFLIFI